jgi:hypothetical protein
MTPKERIAKAKKVSEAAEAERLEAERARKSGQQRRDRTWGCPRPKTGSAAMAHFPISPFELSRWRGGRYASRVGWLAFVRYDRLATGVGSIIACVPPQFLPATITVRQKMVRTYQSAIQNPYEPRPPQPPAAHFKRLYRN